MNGFLGKDFVLQMYISGAFVTLRGQRSTGISQSNEMVDATNKASVGLWRTQLVGGMQSIAATASGVFKDHATIVAARVALFNGTFLQFRAITGNEDYYVFTGKITKFDHTGEHNDAQGYALSVESSGEIVFSGSIAPTVATPTITPSDEDIFTTDEIALACATSGADIYYTTDGSTPTEASTLYTVPFTLAIGSHTVKAIGVKVGYTDSVVLTKAYEVISSQVVTPVISPDGGAVTDEDLITITCATAGADIRYTLNGVDPDGSSILYAAPFPLSPSPVDLTTPSLWAGAWTFDTSAGLNQITSGTSNIMGAVNSAVGGNTLLDYAAAQGISGSGAFGTTSTVTKLIRTAGSRPGVANSAAVSLAIWIRNSVGFGGASNQGPYVRLSSIGGSGSSYIIISHLGVETNTGQVSGASFTLPADNAWHHFVLIVTQSLVKLYKDNVLVYSVSAGTPAGNFTVEAFILENRRISAGHTYYDRPCLYLGELSLDAIALLATGALPAANATLLSSTAPVTVKAIGIKAGMLDSAIESAAFTVTL